MERIVIDERLQDRLAIRINPVELVDDAGHVLGVFTPAHARQGSIDLDGPEPTLEELEAIADSPGPRYTIDEVLARLRSLG